MVLITNLASHTITETRKEALSLRMKFTIGMDNKKFLDFLKKKNSAKGSDVGKDFQKGTAAFAHNKRAFPRDIKALRELKEHTDLVITTADKGGIKVITD